MNFAAWSLATSEDKSKRDGAESRVSSPDPRWRRAQSPVERILSLVERMRATGIRSHPPLGAKQKPDVEEIDAGGTRARIPADSMYSWRKSVRAPARYEARKFPYTPTE